MNEQERLSQLAGLRRLWLHVNSGGKLTESDNQRWGFKLTKESLEKRIVALEVEEWKNVG